MSFYLLNVQNPENDYSTGKRIITAHFECDTVSDLPALVQSTYIARIGSTAHIIDTNATYAVQSNGTWCVQSAGIDVYTKSEIDTLLQPKITINDVYGAGNTIPDTADINDYKTEGIYTRDSTTNTGITNLPAPIATGFGFKLEVAFVSNSERLIQKIYPSWNRNAYYVRQRYRNPTPAEENAWSDWKQIAPFGLLGVQISTSTDIKQLTFGKYFCTNTSLLANLPNDYTAGNVVIEVSNTITSTRRRITIYPAASTPFWICAETGTNTWSNWYKFEGVQV